MFNRIDFADPAFRDAAFMLTLTNGIETNFNPPPRSNEDSETQFYKMFNPHGFIFYSDSDDYEEVKPRKERLTQIIVRFVGRS